MQLQPNTIFASRYQLERLLGRGGFSEVWLAKDNWTHLRIALKVYAPGQGMDANGLQDFCGELANVFDLNHTNLLKPTHVDSWNDMPYLIMAYCSNGSLVSKIGQLTEEEIWKLIHDVGAGLAYLHNKDVVHQDIKPDNILIDEAGNYVITDFGISTRARSTLRKSVVGGSVSGGTTAYMGPERFSRQPAPTKASDIWSFGAMLYEILEGNVPFGEVGGGLQKGGAEIPYIVANVSDALKYTVYKMLSKETWDRPTAETLVLWAKNPQSIEIDYDLLTAEEEPAAESNTHEEETITSSRKTQRFSGTSQGSSSAFQNSPDTTNNAPADNDSKSAARAPASTRSKAWIWILVFLFVGIGTAIGIGVHNQNEKERQEIQALFNQHSKAMSDFDSYLNGASLDNIEALQQALSQLHTIKQVENDYRFDGTCRYSASKQSLLKKADELYNEADRRYQLAPSGSAAEQRSLQKRRQIYEIKQKI
ncbi:MAG: serine/threonine protein kinase [Paludibacteraceae bacterium]|nr:serine/threonine protein kinase [Paludibacteraceae bacterium]